MKRILRALLCLAVLLTGANAYAQRAFSQAELDSLLAPVALYPDPLLTHVMTASLYPQDTLAAAAWSRANPGFQPDDAVRAVETYPWHPSVKALVAYPDVLARMTESPQWLYDLGEAYQGAYPQVADTIQQLRARAQASGYLQSNEYQNVSTQGQYIYVQPVYPTVVYAPYYNPLVVYGTWWWPHYRPVYWRPFVSRPVIVTRVVHPVYVAPRPVVRYVPPAQIVHRPAALVARPFPHPMPTPRAVEARPWRNVPEAQRAPIVQGPVFKQAPVVVQQNSNRGHGNWNRGASGGSGHGNGHGGGRHRG